jgi:hypothetical protein
MEEKRSGQGDKVGGRREGDAAANGRRKEGDAREKRNRGLMRKFRKLQGPFCKA